MVKMFEHVIHFSFASIMRYIKATFVTHSLYNG